MAKYDGLIIPRSYNDYINKSDPAGVAQALQLTGVTISERSVVRVMFTADLTGSDATTGLTLTYNGTDYAVKVGKDGALVALTAHLIEESYVYLQAYTTLELAFDGSQFVVMGNPVVISNADFSIMADGSITYTADKIQGSYQPLILQNQFDNFADLTAFIDDNFSSGIRIGGVATQGTSDPNSPITESGYYWWNIITFGVSNRITQIAVQAYIGYAYTNYMYVREKHDNQWSGWVKV